MEEEEDKGSGEAKADTIVRIYKYVKKIMPVFLLYVCGNIVVGRMDRRIIEVVHVFSGYSKECFNLRPCDLNN